MTVDLSGNSCFTNGTPPPCSSNSLLTSGNLNNVSIDDEDCRTCLANDTDLSNICSDNTLDKPCASLIKQRIINDNNTNKNNADQYNKVVDTYNLFENILDVQSKLANHRWEKTRSFTGDMDETANDIMTKSRIVQLAEEEYDRSKVSMNRLLWFFVAIILIGILIIVHSYKQISSTVLLVSVITIAVVYVSYFFLSEYFKKARYEVDKLQKKTEEILEKSKKDIEDGKALNDIREKARALVGEKCGCPPSTSTSTSTSTSPSQATDTEEIPSFQNEADLYFDGSAPVQQIYPKVQNATGDRVHFNTQADYGQRDNCDNTANPKWKPSGLPKMHGAMSVPTGTKAPMCNQKYRDTTYQNPGDISIMVDGKKTCSGSNYEVSTNFGGNSTYMT